MSIQRLCIPFFLFLGLGSYSPSMAKDNTFIISQNSFFQLLPVYQSWRSDDGEGVSELSTAAMVYIPLGLQASLGVTAGFASVSSNMYTHLSGLSDMQANLNYYAENLSTLISIGANLPTGKKELTIDEFTTSYLISLNQYNFKIPNFGQGLNISPGLSWAIPVSDKMAAGLGISYQYRGPFKPFQGMVGEYDPGEELLITGGLDYRFNETTIFSADFIFLSYNKDKLDGADTYQSGKTYVVNLQFHKYFGFDELRIFARYRSKSKNMIAIAGGFLPEQEKTIPDQFALTGQYRSKLTQSIYATVLCEGRYYQKSSSIGETTVLAVGFTPEFPLSPKMKMPVSLKVLYATIKDGSPLTGYEIGIGIISQL